MIASDLAPTCVEIRSGDGIGQILGNLELDDGLCGHVDWSRRLEGLRARRASRLATVSLPIPPRVTSPPSFRVFDATSARDANTAATSALVLAGAFGDRCNEFKFWSLKISLIQGKRAPNI